MVRILTGVAAALVVAGASAAEPLRLRPGMGGMADPGAASCAYFNGIYDAGPTGFRQALLYWTEGYIHGKAGLTMDQAIAAAANGPWTFDTITDRLVGYCRQHPDAGVPDAAEDLWRALQVRP
jgi:hypothetical protein